MREGQRENKRVTVTQTRLQTTHVLMRRRRRRRRRDEGDE
jgi:hypothetical protein